MNEVTQIPGHASANSTLAYKDGFYLSYFIKFIELKRGKGEKVQSGALYNMKFINNVFVTFEGNYFKLLGAWVRFQGGMQQLKWASCSGLDRYTCYVLFSCMVS